MHELYAIHSPFALGSSTRKTPWLKFGKIIQCNSTNFSKPIIKQGLSIPIQGTQTDAWQVRNYQSGIYTCSFDQSSLDILNGHVVPFLDLLLVCFPKIQGANAVDPFYYIETGQRGKLVKLRTVITKHESTCPQLQSTCHPCYFYAPSAPANGKIGDIVDIRELAIQ